MSIPEAQQVMYKAIQREQWLQFAPGYSEIVLSSTFMPQVHTSFVDVLEPLLKDKGPVRILDVAAASGEPSLSLAKVLPQATIIATDIAETYLPLGQARAEAAGLTNVTFQQADGENLQQFPDNSFDAVTCSLGLMFFPNEKKGLSEFYRVLKPGGVVAVAVWASVVPFFQLAAKVSQQLAPPKEGDPPLPLNTALRFGDAKGLCEDLKNAGFEGVDHKTLEVTFRLSGKEENGGWWGQLWKTPFPLKNAVAQATKNGVVDAYERAKQGLTEEYSKAGFIEEDGSVAAFGNYCNFILAYKPSFDAQRG